MSHNSEKPGGDDAGSQVCRSSDQMARPGNSRSPDENQALCTAGNNALKPDREQAERFLALLAPEATGFTFQTFDDDKDRKKANKEKRREVNKQRKAQGKKPLTSSDDPFAHIYNGFLDTHWNELVRLNAQRVGIFVTINKTDGRGRSIPNIKRVRALFLDLDGAALEPVMQDKHKPHIVVESSPGHWHTYWRVRDVALKQFEDLQKALAARFGGDPSVHDLPRVMRLPGFCIRRANLSSRASYRRTTDHPIRLPTSWMLLPMMIPTPDLRRPTRITPARARRSS